MQLYAMAYHYAAPSNSQILPAQEWNIVMEVMEPCKAVGNPTFGGCGRDYIHGIFPFGMFSNAVWDLFFVENDMHKSHSSGEDKKEKNVVLNSTFFFCLWHVLKFWDLQLGEEGAKPSISLNQSTMRRGPSPVLAFPPPSEYSKQYKPSILFFHGPVHFGKPLLLSRRQNLLKFPSHPTNLQAPNFSSCTIIRFVIIILTVIILE